VKLHAYALTAVVLITGAASGGQASSGLPAAAARSQGEYFVELRVADGTVAATLPRPAGGGIEDIEPDGRGGWFVAGYFDSIGGVECPSLVHLLPSGQIESGWCPRPDGGVERIARAGNTLYVTGSFDSIAGMQRADYAAFDLTTGNLTPWQVRRGPFIPDALAADAGRVVVGDQ
jgi:hypothetical protein